MSALVLLPAAVSALAVLILKRFAVDLKLMASPGDYRHHSKDTPLIGGLAIYFALLVGYFLFDRSFAMLLPCLLWVVLVGVADDRYHLPSVVRFLAQGLAAYAMIELTGTKLETLGYLHPEVETVLGNWSVPITIFATIGVINAVNLSDGMDGLAGSLVAICLLALLITGSPDVSLILISLGAVLGFLAWNLRLFRQHARVFMGDSGSTALGLLLAYCLIRYSQAENGIWPVTALWFLAFPLIDAVAVLLVRPLRRKSPFCADRLHYHHQLVDRGWGVNKALILVLITQCGLVVLGVFAWRMRVADHLQLAVFLFLFVLYFVNVWFYSGKLKSVESN